MAATLSDRRVPFPQPVAEPTPPPKHPLPLPAHNSRLTHSQTPPPLQFVDLGHLQKGPVYEFTLPNLPPKNTVTVNLPKLNMSTIVLPGECCSRV